MDPYSPANIVSGPFPHLLYIAWPLGDWLPIQPSYQSRLRSTGLHPVGLREMGSTGKRLGLLEGPIPKEILELEGLHCELRVRSYSQLPYSSPLASRAMNKVGTTI